MTAHNGTPPASCGLERRWAAARAGPIIEKFRQYADYAERGAPEVKPEAFTVMGGWPTAR
jgi:hypothetical protein